MAVAATDATALVATSNVNVAAGGLVTFESTDSTYAKKVIAITADLGTKAANAVSLFVDGSDTYVFFAGADGTTAADNQIIKLTGVSGTSFDTITVGTTTTDITIG